MTPSEPLEYSSARKPLRLIHISTAPPAPIKVGSTSASSSSRWSKYWAFLGAHAKADARKMPKVIAGAARDRRRAQSGPSTIQTRLSLSLSPAKQPARSAKSRAMLDLEADGDGEDLNKEVQELLRYDKRAKRGADEVVFMGESGTGASSSGSEARGGTEQRAKKARAGALEQLRKKTKKRVASLSASPKSSPDRAARSRFFTGHDSVQQTTSKRSKASKADKAGKGKQKDSSRRKTAVADPSDDEFGMGDDSWLAGMDEEAIRAVENGQGGKTQAADLANMFDDLDHAPSKASGSKDSPLAWSSSPPAARTASKDVKPIISPIRVPLANDDDLVDLTEERDEIDGGVIDLDKEDLGGGHGDSSQEDDWGDDAFFDNMDLDLAFDMPSQQAAAVASQQVAPPAVQVFYASDPNKVVDPSMDPSGPIVEPLVMLDHLRADEREFFLTHWKGKDPTGDRVRGHEKQLQQDREGGSSSTGRASRGRGGGGFKKSWRGGRGGRGRGGRR